MDILEIWHLFLANEEKNNNNTYSLTINMYLDWLYINRDIRKLQKNVKFEARITLFWNMKHMHRKKYGQRKPSGRVFKFKITGYWLSHSTRLTL